MNTALAIVITLLAIYAVTSTSGHRVAIESENQDLKAQVRTLKAQVADPPRLCREYYRRLILKGTK